jgi:hypothetical protein
MFFENKTLPSIMTTSLFRLNFYATAKVHEVYERLIHILSNLEVAVISAGLATMPPSAEPVIGAAIYGTAALAILIASLSKNVSDYLKVSEGDGVEEVDTEKVMHSVKELLEEKLGPYLPGGVMPNRPPDDVVKYYLGENVDNDDFHELPSEVDTRDNDTPDQWIPRHKELIRLTGRHPFNCEAPLTTLFEKGFITPTDLHYVRNHGACPSIAWENHVIHVGGKCPKPLQLKMKDIIALPAHSLPVTLVCCGNRRKEQNMIKQTIGFNWGAAGVSTGVWTGCRLIDLLKLAGVEGIDNFAEGHHIRFASESDLGGDKLPGGVYGTSVTLEKAVSLIIFQLLQQPSLKSSVFRKIISCIFSF